VARLLWSWSLLRSDAKAEVGDGVLVDDYVVVALGFVVEGDRRGRLEEFEASDRTVVMFVRV